MSENNMEYVISVRFRNSRKPYSFGTKIIDLKNGDKVVVESIHGYELAEVVSEPKPLNEVKVIGELKSIARKATANDIKNSADNIEAAKYARQVCEKSIEKLGLEMNLIDVGYTLDKAKVVFVYVADERVDFRELLKELSAALRCRIEMRQVGPRDKAKMIGGIGNCGNETCCSRFMRDFDVISINMAKNQLLALNIQKLSGQCGKLMCCLKNEDDIYSELRKGLPKLNSQIKYKDKIYRLTGINFLSDQVRLDSREESLTIKVADLRELIKLTSTVEVIEEEDNAEAVEFSE